MDRKAILAIVLSVLFFLGWNYFVIKTRFKDQPAVEESKIQGQNAEEAAISELKKDNINTEAVNNGMESSPTVAGLLSSQEGQAGKDIYINTTLAEIVVSTRGGLIKSLKLKEHLNKQGIPLDIVIDENSSKRLPLYLEFNDPSATKVANNIIYEPSVNSVSLSDTVREGSLTLTFKDSSGLLMAKVLKFYNDSYKIDVQVLMENLDVIGVINPASYAISWTGISSDMNKKDMAPYEMTSTFIGKEKKDDRIGKVTSDVTYKGDLLWTAVQNKFFTAVFIPSPKADAAAIIKKVTEEALSAGLLYDIKEGKADNSFTLFAGPKEFDRVKQFSSIKLERIIDFGWFAFFARPLLQGLKFLYRFLHNYGFAIIILTVLIKLVFFPLSNSSFKSMEKMKKLQPQMKIIQDRYKDDKQKLNQELMDFYKKNKLNPMGGCLPMLIQMPVFIALYNVLSNSVELRHAPFIFWITDLSLKDPFYITPVIMGGTMLIQQRMSPQPADPVQAKMMMIMPVIFTVTFLNFPAGLVVYWLVNNVLTIAQQYYIQKNYKAKG